MLLLSSLAPRPVRGQSSHPSPPSPEQADRDRPTSQPESDGDPAPSTGVLEPASYPDDTARSAANVLLFVPRNVLDLLFEGTRAAAGLVHDRQLVPRVGELMSAPGGRIFLFPTMFVETGRPVSFGVRMIGQSRQVTTSFRVGYGIPEDVVLESRLRYLFSGAVPTAITLEGLFERQGELEYLGIGQTPERDPRNHFLSAWGERSGYYQERKVRLISGLGVRLTPLVELFLSASLTRRLIADSELGPQPLSAVFEQGSITGAPAEIWTGYIESATRLDSRPTRGRPSAGVLLEGYLGGAHSAWDRAPLADHDLAFMRFGGRAAGFLPIYRSTNILSPRLVIDEVIPLSQLPLPFTELARQPEFRGFDTRRDGLSLLGSLDYSWQLIQFLGARIFVDAATVAPSLAELSLSHLEEIRYAAGAGLDLYITSDEVGGFAVAAGPEGVRVLFSIGVPSDYGDRQHRD